MNDRLEIASRIYARAKTTPCCIIDEKKAVELADALIAEEARTRKAEAVDPAIGVVCLLVEAKGNTYLVPVDVADELASLRRIGRQLADLVEATSDGKAYTLAVLTAARDLGLGGGK